MSNLSPTHRSANLLVGEPGPIILNGRRNSHAANQYFFSPGTHQACALQWEEYGEIEYGGLPVISLNHTAPQSITPYDNVLALRSMPDFRTLI
jgi:hypothetical protein